VLSWQSSRGYGKWSEQTLLRIEHISGMALIVFALLDGVWISKQLVDRRREMKQDAPALHQH
jgi:hypothetical protein